MRAVNFGLQGNLPPNSDARLQLHWLDAEQFKISAGADGGQFVNGDLNPTGPENACVFRAVDGAFDGGARTTCFLQLPNGLFAQAEQTWRGSVLENSSGNKGEGEWTSLGRVLYCSCIFLTICNKSANARIPNQKCVLPAMICIASQLRK